MREDHSALGRTPEIVRASKTDSARPAIATTFSRLPVRFEPNVGQAAPPTQFLVYFADFPAALGRGGELRIAIPDGAHPTAAYSMQIRGANPNPEIRPRNPLPGNYNYFVGPDPRRWVRGVPGYSRVEYRQVYPGIDLTYYARDQRLEYDWVIAAGADPAAVRLRFSGAPRVAISRAGELVVGTPTAQVRHQAPRAYQSVNGKRIPVTSRYVYRGHREFGFAVGPYDRTKPLVIDPTLIYSITLGGPGKTICCVDRFHFIDQGTAMAVDAVGDVYLAGSISSPSFPLIGSVPASANSFLMKLDASASTVMYGTFFSGNIAGLAVDAAGDAYVTGSAYSTLPVTPGAPQPTFGGSSDAFAAKFSPSGDLIYSTYLGGSRRDIGTAIGVDAIGNAYVVGETNSDDFPILNAFQGHRGGNACLQINGTSDECQDAFVTMVNPQGTAFVYSTYLGGTDYDGASAVAVDPGGNVYVTGRTNSRDFPVTASALQKQFAGGVCSWTPAFAGDAFVAKIGPGGQSPVYATYLGGHGCDFASGIAVDSNGAAYLTGMTESLDLPATPAAFQQSFGGFGMCFEVGRGDAFVAKLNPQGSGLAYLTYLGGISCDAASAISLDSLGNAYVTGRTASLDFPVAYAIQPTAAMGVACYIPPSLSVGTSCSDAFVAVVSAQGDALVQSTFLGSTGLERGTAIGLDAAANIYIMGLTFHSPNFPLFGPQLQNPSSIFLAKIAPGGIPPFFTPNSITDDSGSSGLIPGAAAVISGTNLTAATGDVTAPVPPPTTLMGTSVTINGTPVPILSLSGSSSPQQIKIQVPPTLDKGGATVLVNNNGNVAEAAGVPAGVLIQRTGDAQVGIAEHPLPLPLSATPAANNGAWQITGGGSIAAGPTGAIWTLGPALGIQTAVAPVDSNLPLSMRFTATAQPGNVQPPVVNSVNGTAVDRSPRAVSPGITHLSGLNLSEAPAAGVMAQPTQFRSLPTILAGSQVTFNGLPAQFLFASPTQLSVLVPSELAGYPSAQVVVTVAGIPSAPFTVHLLPASSAILRRHCSATQPGRCAQ